MKILFVTALIVFADQVSKIFVKGFSVPLLNFSFEGMPYGQRFPFIENIFNVTFVENPGIAFGIDFGGEYKLLLSILTLLATIGLGIYLYQIRNGLFVHRFSVALIFGGAIGNLLDRMLYGIIYNYAPFMHGKVVDFIELSFLNLYLFNKSIGSYIFNFADVAVALGVLILIVSFRKQHEEEESMAPIENEAEGVA